MKIKVPTFLDIELSHENKCDVTIATLRELMKWPEGSAVKDGKLFVTKMYHTSHSWTDIEVIREATAADIAIQLLIDKIHKYK